MIDELFITLAHTVGVNTKMYLSKDNSVVILTLVYITILMPLY